MKKIWSCLFWLLGVVILLAAGAVAWAWKPYLLEVSDVNACTADSDCVIVPSGICSRPVSINRSNLKQWELHQKLIEIPPNTIMCAPNLPFDAFQPECLQDACRAVLKEEHAVLEFRQTPRLGEPTELLFRFKTASGVEAGKARINGRLPHPLKIRAAVKVVAPGWGTAYGWLNTGNVLPDNFIYAFVYVDEYNGFYEIRERP